MADSSSSDSSTDNSGGSGSSDSSSSGDSSTSSSTSGGSSSGSGSTAGSDATPAPVGDDGYGGYDFTDLRWSSYSTNTLDMIMNPYQRSNHCSISYNPTADNWRAIAAAFAKVSGQIKPVNDLLTYIYRNTQGTFEGAAADAFRQQIGQVQQQVQSVEHVVDQYSQYTNEIASAIQKFGAEVWADYDAVDSVPVTNASELLAVAEVAQDDMMPRLFQLLKILLKQFVSYGDMMSPLERTSSSQGGGTGIQNGGSGGQYGSNVGQTSSNILNSLGLGSNGTSGISTAGTQSYNPDTYSTDYPYQSSGSNTPYTSIGDPDSSGSSNDPLGYTGDNSGNPADSLNTVSDPDVSSQQQQEKQQDQPGQQDQQNPQNQVLNDALQGLRNAGLGQTGTTSDPSGGPSDSGSSNNPLGSTGDNNSDSSEPDQSKLIGSDPVTTSGGPNDPSDASPNTSSPDPNAAEKKQALDDAANAVQQLKANDGLVSSTDPSDPLDSNGDPNSPLSDYLNGDPDDNGDNGQPQSVDSNGQGVDPQVEQQVQQQVDHALENLPGFNDKGSDGQLTPYAQELHTAEAAADQAMQADVNPNSGELPLPQETIATPDTSALGNGLGGGGTSSLAGLTGPDGISNNMPTGNMAQLDNSVASQEGLSSPNGDGVTNGMGNGALAPQSTLIGGATAGASGMPMSMGGMGAGMGGGMGQQNNNSREPQVWIQGDPGQWSGDDELANPEVLGKRSQ